jgi:molybdenum cofactor guanylyltransferase
MDAIPAATMTGLVLAGGRGARMGGIDKGLQSFHGTPLALHALRRLAPQVGPLLLSANRNIEAYRAFGAPVWADDLAGHAGPLAGFLTGLRQARTPWLLTVPCDTPLFPVDLAARLAAGLVAEAADIAVAQGASGVDADAADGAGSTASTDGISSQPVFCLLRTDLADSLSCFLQEGGRRIGAWAQRHRTAKVRFDRPGDTPEAFFNANTLAELRALEALEAAHD